MDDDYADQFPELEAGDGALHDDEPLPEDEPMPDVAGTDLARAFFQAAEEAESDSHGSVTLGCK